MKQKLKIPSAKEWAGYQADLDVAAAHRLLFGKSNDEVQRFFGGVQSIGRADELLFMPRAAFQYYVVGFAQFVMSDTAQGDSDSASSFLRLLIAREARDAGSVCQIYARLASTVQHLAEHQADYDAAPEIYGSFAAHAAEMQAICDVSQF